MKRNPSLLPILGLAFVIAGCSQQPEQTPEAPSAPSPSVSSPSGGSGGEAASVKKVGPNDKVRVVFITNGASDFWTYARRGVEVADKELANLEAEFYTPSDASAATQTQKVDEFIASGVNAFAISPIDPEGQTEMLNKAAEKVLVFTQDSDAPNSKRACYIGTNNVDAGKMAGDEIKKALPNGGKIMVFVGKKDVQNAKERYQGIEGKLKGSKVSILGLRTDDNDMAKAKSNAAGTLTEYPDVACLVGLWSYNGPKILSAVKDANKVGKVKLVCFDEEDETLEGIKSGAIQSTVVQQPYEFGYRSVKLMDAALRGNTKGIPASKQIFVPTQVINKANVVAFQAKVNRLRAGK